MKKLLFATAVALTGLSAQATVLTFNDFSNTSGLQINGHASAPVVTGDGSVLRLTNAQQSQGGSAFSTNQISLLNNASFSTYFQFRISNSGGISDGDGAGADGLAFVVQTVANNVGGVGGGMGYFGINRSVAVEFDTYNNGEINGNHVGIDLNGSVNSVASVAVAPRLNNGAIWYSWIDYNGSTNALEVRLSQVDVRPVAATLSYNVNLAGAGVLGQTSAYVGFTAATGAAWGNHDILKWEFRDTFNPVGAPDSAATLGLIGLGLAALAAARRRQLRR